MFMESDQAHDYVYIIIDFPHDLEWLVLSEMQLLIRAD